MQYVHHFHLIFEIKMRKNRQKELLGWTREAKKNLV